MSVGPAADREGVVNMRVEIEIDKAPIVVGIIVTEDN
jgi:hypothetical protein